MLSDGQPVIIRLDSGRLSDLSLAYALTIQTAHGSEFSCAIVLVHKARAARSALLGPIAGV